MKYYTLDRIEGSNAVLLDENGAVHTESIENVLPAKEGDILLFDGEKYHIDENETAKRKRETKSLIDALFQ